MLWAALLGAQSICRKHIPHHNHNGYICAKKFTKVAVLHTSHPDAMGHPVLDVPR
jgi:hypothetical protein